MCNELNGIINILLEFEGIVGAILGSVATLVVTHILSHSGRLKSYVVDSKLDFITYFENHHSLGKLSHDKLERVSLKYTVQVYNKSDVYKIMRDFKVDFYKNKEFVFSVVPQDESTRTYSQYITHVDEMEVANIPAHEIVVFKHSLNIWESAKSFAMLDGVTAIKMSYYNEKDKRKQITIYTGLIDMNQEFENKVLQLAGDDIN